MKQASFIPRETPTRVLRQLYRRVEQSLAGARPRSRIRQWYRIMRAIETELDLRRAFPKIEMSFIPTPATRCRARKGSLVCTRPSGHQGAHVSVGRCKTWPNFRVRGESA